MQPTKTLQEFVRCNDREMRRIVTDICFRYGVSEKQDVDDVLQKSYTWFAERGIIEKYDPNYSKGASRSPKISTYLFPIIDNIAKIHIKGERKHTRVQFLPEYDVEGYEDVDDVEMAMRCKAIVPEYEGRIEAMQISEDIEGLRVELKDFQNNFLVGKRDKTYKLNRRKNKDNLSSSKGCSIKDVFDLLDMGLGNTEIAGMYGVSAFFITLVKGDLKEALSKYGISWKPSKSKDRSRSRNGSDQVSKV